MGQFLNYITKKQTGGDIQSLPGVLSLSAIQKKINMDKQKAVKREPELRQYTPKPGDMERQRRFREEFLKEENSLINRVATNPTFNKFMDNIVDPMMTIGDVYGLGAVGRMGVKALGRAGKNIYSDPVITKDFIDWGDAVDYVNNPGFNPRLYERAVKSSYAPPTTDPNLKPFLTHKDFKKGGMIVDRRGQWAHPGKEVIVPTENGRITMKGVPYLVYGQDENGFGQLMMPGGEYKFTGNNVYEKPINMFNYEMAYGGQMIRRADGSYSRRGLWDNIRANRGSGKKPTKEMLEQERKIRAAEKAMYGMEVYQQGGEPDGEMALGQINAALDKLMTLRQFIQPESDLEPWVSSKLTMMDHYADAVSDYMMFNPEATEEGYEGDDLDMMAQGGGIPERYKNMGFNKVGVKKKSTRPGKKWMVLAKKGDQYKVVHGGYKGMQDYTQHGSDQRRKNFWNRMGGKNSSKATDPFSPLYWHKRFGTWEDGGQIEMMKGGGTFSGNLYYQDGGEPRLEDYPDFGSYRAAYEQWLASGQGVPAEQPAQEQPAASATAAPVQQAPVASAPARKASYSGPSVVDMLTSMGMASDYQSRKQMAQQMGIANYRGTAAQNIEMMRRLQSDPNVAIPEASAPARKPSGTAPKKEDNYYAGKQQYWNSQMADTSRAPKPASQPARPKAAKSTSPAVDNSALEEAKLIDERNRAEQTRRLVIGGDENATFTFPNGKTKKWKDMTWKEKSYVSGRNLGSYQNNNWTDYINPLAFIGGLSEGIGTMFYDADESNSVMPYVTGIGKPLAAGLLSRLAVGKTRTLPNPRQLPAPPPKQLPNSTTVFPRGWTIPSQNLRSPGFPMYKQGGIHINPENRGKFTASAKRAGMSVQEFADHVLANKEDYSSTQVKRANFARNAAGWKKQFGGPMEGDELEVTPEELEMLRAQGYEFEMI